MLRLSREEEEGPDVDQSCGGRTTVPPRHPEDASGKQPRIAGARFHRAGSHRPAELPPPLRPGRHQSWVLFFKGDVRKALILISLPRMGFKNDLFSFPSVFGKMSACAFSPFSSFISGDFVKLGRGEADFCLIFKISGFFILPVRLNISVNVLI